MGLESSLVNGRFRRGSIADTLAQYLVDNGNFDYEDLESDPVLSICGLDSLDLIDYSLFLKDEFDSNMDLSSSSDELASRVNRRATFSELVQFIHYKVKGTDNNVDCGIDGLDNRTVLISPFYKHEFRGKSLNGYATINQPIVRAVCVGPLDGSKKKGKTRDVYEYVKIYDSPQERVLGETRTVSLNKCLDYARDILTDWYTQMGREVRVVD